MSAFSCSDKVESRRRAPTRLSRAQPSNRSRRVARAHRRARCRRGALSGSPRARGTADLLPRRALRTADVRRRRIHATSSSTRSRWRTTSAVRKKLLLDHLYVHAGEDVARHLCKVATSLDSLVLGETEILGQVQEAFESECGLRDRRTGPGAPLPYGDHLRPPCSRGDRDRREPGHRELAGARARRRGAGRSPREAHPRRGGGSDRAADAEGSRGAGSQRAEVANRTKHRAIEVSERFGAVAHDLTELEVALASADVAISATSSEAQRVAVGVVRAAMSSRAERPLVLVDLAVPADVEREAGEVVGVRLFDVDDLRAGLDGAMAARLRLRRSRRSSRARWRTSAVATGSSRSSRCSPSCASRRGDPRA